MTSEWFTLLRVFGRSAPAVTHFRCSPSSPGSWILPWVSKGGIPRSIRRYCIRASCHSAAAPPLFKTIKWVREWAPSRKSTQNQIAAPTIINAVNNASYWLTRVLKNGEACGRPALMHRLQRAADPPRASAMHLFDRHWLSHTVNIHFPFALSWSVYDCRTRQSASVGPAALNPRSCHGAPYSARNAFN